MMSTNGDEGDGIDVEAQGIFDDTAQQGCYVFEPSPITTESQDERPAKRRKTRISAIHTGKQITVFPSLFESKEDPRSVQIRHNLFEEIWSRRESAVEQVVGHFDASLLANIVEFVQHASPDGQYSRIPSGLVLTGHSHGSQVRLLEHWRASQGVQPTVEIVTLDSSQAPNLTTALKNIIRSVIVQRRGADWYQVFLQEHKRSIPMNYDLELLQTFVERERLEKIAISILDAEVFDVNVLSDLISALSSWIDRLPIVLLFGIATTTELFEARLPKRIVKLLQGKVFSISPQNDNLYMVYRTMQDDYTTKLWIGPALSSILLERSKDQDESAESFAAFLRYLHMSHFFANPLSVLLTANGDRSYPMTAELCHAVRNTSSFRRYAEDLLDSKEANAVEQILNNDEHLLDEAIKAVSNGQQTLVELRQAIRYFIELHSFLHPSTNPALTPFEIDNQAFSGSTFLEGSLYNDVLALLEKLPSDALENLLIQCPFPDSATEFSTSANLSRLDTLHKASSGIPIRCAQDPKHNTTSTTISRNNTVSLAKHEPKLSKLEKEYTSLVQDIHHAICDYFESRVIDIDNLFMHEAFVYDLKMPLASAFIPRPRHAIERALARPGDYFGCECCTADGRQAEGMRNDRLPPTSLLWQLWCEAGSIVNVRDLWEAFSAAIVDRGEEHEDEEGGEAGTRSGRNGNVSTGIDERTALALFYRSLAELRMLGFVKPTKKKVDCLAKAAWKGL